MASSARRRLTLAAILSLSALLPAVQAAAPAGGTLPYKDPDLAVEVRVRDLLGRMTLEEKLWQLFMAPGDLEHDRHKLDKGIFGLQFHTTPAGSAAAAQILRYGPSGSAAAMAEMINSAQRFFVEETRLGIPIIPFDEALHGLVRDGATAFPQAIGLAATWDPELIGSVAAAIARECRSRGIRQVLSPVVNVATDVRWGRVEESYGEDPLLSAEMGLAFVRAFEASGIITTPKHFVANHGEGGRDSYPVHHSERLLEELYLPPFAACIGRGGSRSLMISYNSLDGRPCTANDWLLNRKLKGEWGFRGFVISDAGAVGGITDLHGVSADYEASVKSAFENGLDVLFQSTIDHFELFFTRALRGSYIDSLVIDRAVARVLRAKFELGLFEDPYVDPAEAGRVNGTTRHRELARQAARESIVLLKNRAQTLPLSRAIRSISVIGPEAAEARLGGYSGPGIRPVSILEGIRARAGELIKVNYARGCSREETEVTVIPERWLRRSPSPEKNEAAWRGAPRSPSLEAGGGEAGLVGRYWANPDFDGAPLFERFDARIDFNWSLFSPHSGLQREWFSAAWSGELVAPADGRLRIGLEGNDGFRLWIGDSLLIDNGEKGSYHRVMAPWPVRKNLAYPLRIEFCERKGGGRLRLLWDYRERDEAGDGMEEAVAAARASEVAVICAGIVEGEGLDRASLRLPGRQEELIRAVAATGVPVIVLLTAGSAVTMNSWLDEVEAVAALWYPGEEGGHAVTEMLFGDYNPAGRLPVTFPLAEGQLPLVYHHKPTGRLDYYHDLPGEPLFPFGYGLSYTRFSYKGLELASPAQDSLLVRFELRNSGPRGGDEVVQLYTRRPRSDLARPLMALKKFARIHLEPGESRQVVLTLGRGELEELDQALRPVVEPGRIEIMIGASSADIRLRGGMELP
ncbi:MAG TPA: glycoside hydrolase family 3 C-terminal domain-containing protein [bacterium]|nr:glycoside hydrolase family 3 C-terminal domain-containing protein [bacterium]